MSNLAIEIWAEALHDVLKTCLPYELRLQVLNEMLERDREHKPFRIISVTELMAMEFAPYREKKEALALLVQIMVRSITNNHSPETAAGILFRDHYGYGTGSGWLPDYLDSLPGFTVNIEQCAAISKAAGPGRLRKAMAEASA